jgi:hypothetical protein
MFSFPRPTDETLQMMLEDANAKKARDDLNNEVHTSSLPVKRGSCCKVRIRKNEARGCPLVVNNLGLKTTKTSAHVIIEYQE